MTDEDELERSIETIACKLARIENLPLNVAQLHARSVLGKARQRYRNAGAPYGDTVAGFMTWWLERF